MEILVIVLALLGALVVPTIVMDVRERRRAQRLWIHGDHNDIYRTVPYAAPEPGAGAGGVDSGA